MRNNFLLYLLLFLSLSLSAQDDDLPALIDAAAEELVEVTTEKYRYEQSLEYDAEKPWRVTITITEINIKNDKSETTRYFLNLADLDPRLINVETDKDEQLVWLKCAKKQEFIRTTDDDGDVYYESDLKVWSPEIDRGTALRDLFRQAAESAEEAWKKDFAPSAEIGELNAWLADNVQPVEEGEGTTEVSWTGDSPFEDGVTLTISDPEGEEVTTYKFSLADLAKNSMKLVVRKGSVGISVTTVNKINAIRKETDGALSGYENSLLIPVSGIEEARRLLQSLEAVLPLSRKIREARMPKPSSLDEALQLAAELVTGAKRGDKDITATLAPSPLTTLDLSITDTDKGETKTEKYLFDFGDLNAKKIDLNIKGLALDVVVLTRNNDDLIQAWEEGEDAGFNDEVTLPVADIETARKLEALLPYLIEEASKLPVPIGDFNSIEEAVKSGGSEEVNQTVKQREGACKWSYQWTEEGKKTEEILYEFNLYDLDARKVSYEVSNKGIFLLLPTIGKEETINVYENGDPKFTNLMSWRLTSVSDAKQLAATMQALIEACKE